jgi:ribosome-binding factor A
LVSKLRIQRIADRIREELSEMMLQDVQDPRLEGISITDVTVDRELAFAEVYVSAVEGSERAEEILQGLRHAGGFLRSELARRVELRTFPRLRFHWDPTPERAEHIEQLLDSLQARTTAGSNDDDSQLDERATAND